MKATLLIVGIILFGCSGPSNPEKELTKNASDVTIEQGKSIKETQRNDSILIFDQLKVGERTLYVDGGTTIKDASKINGIYIKRLTDTQVEYSYSQVINWKLQFRKNGIAELISVSDSITTNRETKESAFKFVDAEKDIVFFVTKNKYTNGTKAKIYNKKGRQLSELMYNK